MTARNPDYQTKPGHGAFGSRLKEERKRRRFQIMQFASMVGVAPSQITAWENRGVLPSLTSAIQVARELDCSLDWLCGLED
jgi:transcriptional regulator with XRE-family HTH domain